MCKGFFIMAIKIMKKIEVYPQRTLITYMKRPTAEKSRHYFKTVYDEEQIPYVLTKDTGEVRLKRKNEVVKVIRDSVNRAKKNFSAVLDANHFDFFGTLTFDNSKCNSYDLEECKRLLSQWSSYLRKKNNVNIMYAIVPEQHMSGAWHFHLLLKCEDLSAIGGADSGKVCCSILKKGCCSPEVFEKLKHACKVETDGAKIYNIKSWTYGFSNFTKIKNMNKARSYLKKYMNKSFAQSTDFKKRFFTSRNLSRPIKYVSTFECDIHSNADIKKIAKSDIDDSTFLVNEIYYSKRHQIIEYEDISQSVNMLKSSQKAFEKIRLFAKHCPETFARTYYMTTCNLYEYQTKTGFYKGGVG